MPKSGVDRHRRRRLEKRQLQLPGEEFGDIQCLAAAKPDDAAAVRQPGNFVLQLVAVDGIDQVRTSEVVIKMMFKERPEVIHGDDEVGTVGDIGQFADEIAGRKIVVKPGRSNICDSSNCC